jgi:hypothetical protein
MPKRKYKVGDKVKVVKSLGTTNMFDSYIGEVDIITEVSDDIGTEFCYFISQFGSWWCDKELVPLEKNVIGGKIR